MQSEKERSWNSDGVDRRVGRMRSGTITYSRRGASLLTVYSPQADLPCDPERRAAVDSHPRVDERVAGVQDPIRGPTARLAVNHRLHS